MQGAFGSVLPLASPQKRAAGLIARSALIVLIANLVGATVITLAAVALLEVDFKAP